MYRPKDWENPYTTEHGNAPKLAKTEAPIYEAGADAMLEGLKKEGFKIKIGDSFEIEGVPITATKNQVFIILPEQ